MKKTTYSYRDFKCVSPTKDTRHLIRSIYTQNESSIEYLLNKEHIFIVTSNRKGETLIKGISVQKNYNLINSLTSFELEGNREIT